MKKINVAINGFGRIGRSTFKVLFNMDNVNIVAINDLANPHTLAYLLRYDSIYHLFSYDVKYDDEFLYAKGEKIRVYSEKDNEKLPWKELDIDIVLESTGVFRTTEQINKHIKAGAKKVILTAPPKDHEIKIIVLGINDDDVKKEDVILSNASCTTNCLAPLVKILDEIGKIENGMATTIHAYTADQKLIDSPHKDLRRARAAATNIIPTSTGAAKATVELFPHLKGRLNASAYRVPVMDGSVTDLICKVKNKLTVDEINTTFREASESYLKGILGYTDHEIVSSDIIGSPLSSMFDSKLTEVHDDMVRLVSWYDNESGYSHRLADLVQKVGTFL